MTFNDQLDNIPNIEVEGGLISGVPGEKSHTIIFKGVPYAAPPIGKLRWCPPHPVVPWEAIRKCDTFGKICPQPFQPEVGFYRKEFYDMPDPEASEDCLYLNVWVPKQQLIDKSSPIPVSIYIHGGAFDHGWSHEKEFDGEAFNEHNTIYISINYRVNLFGFLTHPLLIQNEETKLSCNNAVLDVLKAIRWVKQYIPNFGGDPNRITLFGQSAGSMLTSALSILNDAKGLFNNVIFQSGIGYQIPMLDFIPLEKAMKIGQELMEPFNVKSVEDMQKIPMEDLLNRFLELSKTKQELLFSLTIDGKTFIKSFTESVDENSFHPQNIIIGYNSKDIFEDLLPKSINLLSKTLLKQGKNVFTYYFSPDIPGDDSGAFHSCELWYVFGTLKRCWRPFTEKDYNLSKIMISYWCNFISKGDPNQPGLPEWPKLTNQQNKSIELNYNISYIENS